ncbi:GNAT family N-acetyltransferase [Nocardia amikacinitolerans]|uniref:GNAT family N-acetyltransferase n=1 Tax=Nocardia amikacinitolerans TaxID=756689 RepID=UPI0020A53604|nr:GNAT family N-acetyltransferase [Nocardia amikacinitolerans]MCP2287995.1 Acetyltransferase (GNAT) family protein [Nocardia amikacinitolerans]
MRTEQSSPPAPPTVRPATPSDIPRATRTLGRAFADYAWTRHTIDARDHERRVRDMQELFLTRIGLPHGRVWVADEGAAVAVWTTPATDVAPVFVELAPLFAELAGDRARAYAEAEVALAPHRPAEPAWFLGTVGVDPDEQGRGLGAAVIRPGLAAAERAGVSAFLETSEERNVGFYERLGFRVTAAVDLPDGGPTTWAMLRDRSV